MGVVEDHLTTIAKTSQAVGDTRYLQEFRGQVEDVSGSRLKVKRLDQSEAFWAPLVATSHKPKAGDWVRGYQFHGQAIILGADGKASDKDVPQLDLQKLARDGSQPMTGSLNVERALAGSGKAMQTLRATDGDEARLILTTAGTLRLYNQTTGQILADFLRNGQLDATLLVNAVTGREIASSAVANAHIATNAVGSRTLAGNAVGTGHISDESVVNAKIGTNAVGSRTLAGNAVANAHISDNAVGSRALAGNAVERAHMSTSAVSYPQISPTISGDNTATGASPSRGDKGLRKMGGSGSGLVASSADHSHSVQFDTMSREIRGLFIAKRRKVREIRDATKDDEKRGLASMVLALCHLLMDDEEYDAEERERRLRDDPEFRAAFAKKHTHEYPDSQARTGPVDEPRRKKADGHLLKAHPDVAG